MKERVYLPSEQKEKNAIGERMDSRSQCFIKLRNINSFFFFKLKKLKRLKTKILVDIIYSKFAHIEFLFLKLLNNFTNC